MMKKSTWRNWGGSYHGPRQVFEQKLSVAYDKHQQHMDVLRLTYENSLKVAVMLMEKSEFDNSVKESEYQERVSRAMVDYEVCTEKIWKKYDEVTAEILADYTSKMKVSGNKRNSNMEPEDKEKQ